MTFDPLAWLADHGIASPRTLRRLERATTADLFVVDDLVLRWYHGGTFLDQEPDALVREVAALTTLAASIVPAPQLVAWTEQPAALLMTRVEGEHRYDVADPAAVNELLDTIHGLDPGRLAPWAYRGYHEGIDLPPPAWWRDTAAWDRAVRLSSDGRPESEAVVIHRDFHPGNILWSGGVISGVLDWGNACLGPASFDLAHHRVNLATLVGQAETDRAYPGDPHWDIEAALGYVDPWAAEARDEWVAPWPDVPPEVARQRVEGFLTHALAELG